MIPGSPWPTDASAARAGATMANYIRVVGLSQANRDELGTVSRNLNSTSAKLSALYDELRSLNAALQERVAEQVKQLEGSQMLKPYLSPQVADSVIAGTRSPR